ncbi:hypothetical protein [Candidatus Uabimicrobium sp. HlEnr_7]|uniref:hypothetical protein n=1 Tax=Candidatus Uabimicrobium helgolandensis TaxID=3095367 RepID=UPI003555CED5
MSSKSILFSFVIIMLLFVPQLEAKMLITYGDDIAKVADLPEAYKQMAPAPDAYIGYKYGQFGVFWLEIWTWSGEYCLYSESQNTYWSLNEELVATLNKEIKGGLKVPSSYSYPPGLLIVIVIVVILIFIGKNSSDDNEAPSEDQEGGEEKPQA